jgi:3,4-dihydroxy-9,10-secoandrosta-1,3,5(10)-triene-9,17-dione 4,5-dioxygenase
MSDHVQIVGLGYLGIYGDDLDAWSRFATDFLGMERVAGADDPVRFRMDVRSYRLAVHQGEPGLAYLGWEVPSPDALEAAAAALEEAGVAVKHLGPEEASQRAVAGLIACDDPAGNRVELFYGALAQDARRLRSPYAVRFVTEGQGLGHVVLTCSRYEETIDFYSRVLGFRVRDVRTGGRMPVTFLGCNTRHHSVALIDSRSRDEAQRQLLPDNAVQHLMIEVEEFDMLGEALDRATDQGVPMTMSLGRHCSDHMNSFYVRSPSGFAVEYGWGGRQVDDATWSTVGGGAEFSFWGHRPVSDEWAALVKANQVGQATTR